MSSEDEVSVRLAKVADVPAICELAARSFTVMIANTIMSQDRDAYINEAYSYDATAEILDDPKKDLIVATSSSGQILAYALLTRNSLEPCVSHLPETVELQRIYVDPVCPGKGIGSALVKHLEEIAKQQGFKHMWLGVWQDNARAQKFYQKLGFTIVGEHDFQIGGVIQRDNIRVKSLY